MTKPKLLRLAPLDIPVEIGCGVGDRYAYGLDVRGTLYLTFQCGNPPNRPRLSVMDPHWNAFCGLRYIEWVTP